MPSDKVGMVSQLGVLSETDLGLQPDPDDALEEDYDAAVDMFHRNCADDSVRSVECPWGPTPEHSFNEAELQTGTDLMQALDGLRLASTTEHRPKSEVSTEEGEST